jgi:putative ATP-dependent endonuclease of the OLD family
MIREWHLLHRGIMETKNEKSGIMITEARIHNFRSLQNISVNLDWLTMLIGQNNSGKTSFLDALFLSIGAGRRTVSVEDIFLAPTEKKVPKDRAAFIDLIIRPTDGEVIVDTFPEGSYWIELWGEGISQDELENDFVGMRTQIKWDSTKGEYEIGRNFLKEWKEYPDNWVQSGIKDTISSSQIEPINLHLLNAKRDIKDELQNRTSFWYKLVSDLDLDDTAIVLC